MIVKEFLEQLSRGEFSNLSIGNEGSGQIEISSIPKIVGYINDGLTQIYSRFILSTKQLLIEQIEGVTQYHLLDKYAEMSTKYARFKYIKDLPGDPFTGDVIKILEVSDECGNCVLNDVDDPKSFFTPTPHTLQVPYPKQGKSLAVQYQARHVVLKPDALTEEIDLPFFLENALRSYVAYKLFSHMNGQDNMVKSQEHLNAYESICLDVETRDLVNMTFSTSHRKLEARGFV